VRCVTGNGDVLHRHLNGDVTYVRRYRTFSTCQSNMKEAQLAVSGLLVPIDVVGNLPSLQCCGVAEAITKMSRGLVLYRTCWCWFLLL